MTINAITDTKKRRTGIAPTYLHTTQNARKLAILSSKNKNFSGEGAQPPPQIPPPVGRGTPPPHTPHPSAPRGSVTPPFCFQKKPSV